MSTGKTFHQRERAYQSTNEKNYFMFCTEIDVKKKKDGS